MVATALERLQAALAAGNAGEAESIARAALDDDPGEFLIRAHLGSLVMARGEVEEAVEHFQAAVEAGPEVAELHNELGNALALAGEPVWAEAALRRASELEPEVAQIHNNLGNVLRQQGRLADAIDSYRVALELAPDYGEAFGNLGIALQESGDIDGAIGQYRAAIERRPKDALSHTHLGVALAAKGELEAAVAAHRRALEHDPDLVEAHNNLGIALKDQGALARAADSYRIALALRPGDAAIHSNLLMSLCYDPAVDGAALLAAHREWDAAHGSGVPPSFEDDADPDRVLRVGYVSPDFYSHSVASFVEPVLAHHDRSQVFVACYSDVAEPDLVTARLKSASDLWRDTVGMSDTSLFGQIREDRIDILVDLAGHTANNRLPVFARRAAPVQATWIGYPATTGLAAMDYRLTDDWADPPGTSDGWHSETLLRLPGGFLCYGPPANCPEPAEAAGKGPVNFASFNNLSKVGAEVVATWAATLQAAPGLRLLLKSRQLADTALGERLLAEFAKHGIEAARIELRGRIASRAVHLALYREVDIALDTFPYNGTTTTCEALWMGVPVVTLAGDRHAGRVGVSLLEAAGFADWIASNEGEYVDTAARLAADRPPPGEIRSRLASSKLTDARRFTAVLEAALRGTWRDKCRKSRI